VRRTRYREGGGFEDAAAYSRAVRHGHHVAVSGTAALDGRDGSAAGDAYVQARDVIARALAAAEQLGARREDVLRTRLLLAPGCDIDAVVRAHAEAFAGVEPANTTYFVGGLVPEGALVEVELDAVVDEPPR
jgi:enamine deaminase RidA (YjgF/YER057c/UK114 family)